MAVEADSWHSHSAHRRERVLAGILLGHARDACSDVGAGSERFAWARGMEIALRRSSGRRNRRSALRKHDVLDLCVSV